MCELELLKHNQEYSHWSILKADLRPIITQPNHKVHPCESFVGLQQKISCLIDDFHRLINHFLAPICHVHFGEHKFNPFKLTLLAQALTADAPKDGDAEDGESDGLQPQPLHLDQVIGMKSPVPLQVTLYPNANPYHRSTLFRFKKTLASGVAAVKDAGPPHEEPCIFSENQESFVALQQGFGEHSDGGNLRLENDVKAKACLQLLEIFEQIEGNSYQRGPVPGNADLAVPYSICLSKVTVPHNGPGVQRADPCARPNGELRVVLQSLIQPVGHSTDADSQGAPCALAQFGGGACCFEWLKIVDKMEPSEKAKEFLRVVVSFRELNIPPEESAPPDDKTAVTLYCTQQPTPEANAALEELLERCLHFLFIQVLISFYH